MSRIGRQPINIPAGVTFEVNDNLITVKGSKGVLTQTVLPQVSVKSADNVINVERASDSKISKSNHGLMRALIYNMIKGVSDGYFKKLEINGVGYRVASSGNELNFSLGFSHPTKYKLSEGISAAIEQNIITISGYDKQKVGQAAAEIRSLKKPEPYKGKGIKYVGERIIRKSGKSGKEKA